VRAGVAPDHPKIKSVTKLYERTAEHPRLRLFANVEFGRHVTLEDLRRHYHAVVYAVGTPIDRPLGIPGEELEGSYAATDFVGWYNGHPDFCDHEFDLHGERAIVIGAGNVALDVARMLVLGHDELRVTDIADHALDVLEHSGVREVLVVARRGPMQAAFTNPELLELGELADADVIVDLEELDRALAVHDAGAEADATSRRNVEILRSYAEREPSGRPKRVVLRFLLSPTALLAGEDGRLGAVELVRNELVPGTGGALRAQATEQRETIAAGLAFRAIGYRGVPLPGVPFDERSGTIPNDGGRVLDPASGVRLPGEYVVGWIKRGPSGVIGTNKKDAQETVDAILADLAEPRARLQPAEPDASAVEEMLRECQPALVTYAGWSEIDRHERARGEASGRPRVKLTQIEEMLRIAACEEPSVDELAQTKAR
jgi:ferredoxin--NADP+ reductase